MTATFISEPIKAAVQSLKAGLPILLLDASDRENEGDLVIAAENITAESMNFLIKKGSGVVCLAMPKDKLEKLGIPMMTPHNTNTFETAFTVSIEASAGVTTGVSAKDRAHTIKTAISDHAQAQDLAKPGHVFPLAARINGVFDRMGHTEASVDLMKIAQLKPGAVLCELMNEDGSMTIGPDRISFALQNHIPLVYVEEVLFHRIRYDNIIKHQSEKIVNTTYGPLKWQQTVFFDDTHVDILVSSALKPNNRLRILENLNPHTSLIECSLGLNDGDQISQSLEDLKRNQIEMIALINKADVKQPQCSQKLFAYLCRALIIHNHNTKIFSPSNHTVFDSIAKKYFSFTINHSPESNNVNNYAYQV